MRKFDIRRAALNLLAPLLVASAVIAAVPVGARADVTAKFHDQIYGTDLVIIANRDQNGKKAAIGIAKDNNTPFALFPDLATWNQFVALWNRAKAAPDSAQKQKIGTFIDQTDGNVMGVDVGKDGIFFFITDSNTTQLFVLKKADEGKFDDDVQNVTLFLSSP